MKKCIVILIVIFAVHMQAMDITLNKKTDNDYQFFLIAKKMAQHPSFSIADYPFNNKDKAAIDTYHKDYPAILKEADSFVECSLDKSIINVYKNYCQLSKGVQYELIDRYKDTPLKMLFDGGNEIVCKDIVNNIVNAKISSSSSIVNQQVDIKDFSGEDVMAEQYTQYFGSSASNFVSNEPKETLNFDEISDILKNNDAMNLTLQGLSDLCQGKKNYFEFTVFDDENEPSNDRAPVVDLTGNLRSPDEKRIKIMLGLDFILKVGKASNLLHLMCENGKEGQKILRYQLTDEDRTILLCLNEKVQGCIEWKALQDLPIAVDCTHVTRLQKFKDIVLFAIPLALVDGLIPWGIYGCINGRFQGLIGAIAGGISGYFIGNKIFPFLDSYNSGVGRLREFFGEQGVRKISWGCRFAMFSVMHYVMIGIKNRLLYSANSLFNGIGYFIEVFRLGLFLFSLFHQKQKYYTSFGVNSIKDFIIAYFGDMKFGHPFFRRNKDDKVHTLGDLFKTC